MSKGIARVLVSPISIVIGRKATRTLLQVVGVVASFIPGGQFIAAAAFIASATLFAPKAKTASVALSALDRLNASLDPSAPRKMVFGTTAGGTDIRYVEASGTNQENVDYIIAVAAHKVSAISQIWLEDTLAWDVSTGVQSGYSGFLTVDVRTEGTSANAIAINGGAHWGASCRLTGCAYVHLRINRAGTNSPFSSGLNSRMTIIVDGIPVYDPRLDSTVPGGAGTQRADDQTTWTFANGHNLALQALTYLLGWRIGGEVSVGRGIPPARLDLEGWITSANLCDEAVTTSGGSQPRYHGGALISEADDPNSVMTTMATTCNGRFREGLGKLGLVVMHNDLALITTDPGLGDDEMIGGFTWDSDPSLEETYNVVRGRYTDPSNASLYQLVDYPEVRISTPPLDGIDRILTLDLPWCQDAAMAQRIAKQVLERKQYDRTLTAVFNMAGWAYKVGDPVPITLSALGMNRNPMRVEQQIAGFDGTCPMVLRQEADALYAWDADDRAPVTPAAAVRYDPLNNPILVALRGVTVIEGSADGSSWHRPPVAGDIFLRFSNDGGVTFGPAVELGAEGSLVGYLTNESATVAATSTGTVSSFTGTGGAFVVMLGLDDVTAGSTFSVVSSSGVTISIATDGTYTITAMSADTGTATLRATFDGITVDKVYSISKSKAGADGSPAKILTVITDRQTITYDGTGAINPSTQTTNFSVNKQGTTATVNWSMTKLDGTALTASLYLSATSGDTVTMTAANFDTARGTTNGVIVTGTLTDGVTVTDKISIVKVQAGLNAPLLFLTSTAQTVTFDSGGAASPSGQSISLTANLQNVTGTATWTATAYNASGASLGAITLGGSGNSRTMSDSQFTAPGATAYAVITATLGALSDTTTIVRLTQGSDAIVASLTNESATVAADSAGTVASFASAGGTFKMYKGTADITTGNGVSYSVLSSSGATGSINSSTGVYSISAMSADQGTITFRAAYGTQNYDKVYNIAKSKAGTAGAAGTSTFTLINQIGMTITGATITQASGTGWGSGAVRSAESYTNGASCSFKVATLSFEMFMGLSSVPTSNSSYTSIDYAWYTNTGGQCSAWQSGVQKSGNFSVSVGDILQVVYSGNTVNWLQNGVVKYTLAVSTGTTLTLRSASEATGASATNLTFAAAGANGTNGSGGATTAWFGSSGATTGTGTSNFGSGLYLTAGEVITLGYDGTPQYVSGSGTNTITGSFAYSTNNGASYTAISGASGTTTSTINTTGATPDLSFTKSFTAPSTGYYIFQTVFSRSGAGTVQYFVSGNMRAG